MKKIKNVRNIRFHTFPDKRSQNRFRVIANSGKVLAKSAKGYDDLVELIDVATWLVEELRVPNIYQDKVNAYRWRVKRGGEPVIVSAGAFSNRADAVANAWLVLESTLK